MRIGRWMAGGLLAVGLAGAAYGAPGETRQLRPERVAEFPQPDGRTLVLENLGRPLPEKVSPVEFVTVGADGERIAWAVSRATLEHFLLGYGEKSGLHKLELTEYFAPHSYKPSMAPAGDSIYMLVGNKGPALLKYHIPTRKTTVLRKYKLRLYYLGLARDSKKRLFWATSPRAEVIGVDPATDEVFSLGRMSEEAGMTYALNPAIDADDVLYVPIGQKYNGIVAVDLKNNRRRQILTPAEIDAFAREQSRMPRVLQAGDAVYTQIGGKVMRCTFDGLTEPAEEIAFADIPTGRLRNGRFPSCRFNERETALYFDREGLVLGTADGGRRRIAIPDLPVVGHELYAVGGTRDGVLYGSGIFPANVFGVNLKTLVATDFGMGSRGGVQNYDLAATPYGVLMCSYVGAYFDLLDPAKPFARGVNPRPVGDLRAIQQERPVRLTAVGDGSVQYVGTMPVKNRLGGAIARIDLKNGRVDSWCDIIANQSIMDLVVVPASGLLFGTASVKGGTDSVAVEKSAAVFLFDPATGQVVWRGVPEEGATYCQGSAVTGDGRIMFLSWGRAGYRWHLFDPAERRFVRSRRLQRKNSNYFAFSEKNPVGPDRKNYFTCGGALYEYDFRQEFPLRLFRHPSLEVTRNVAVAPDGCFYYLDECRLMRVKVY